jgi:hypothetical protein
MSVFARIVTFLSVVIGIISILITDITVPAEWSKFFFILIFLLILVIIGLLLYIDGKVEIIKSLEKQLNSETKGLMKYYGELSRFEQNKSIMEFMRIFLEKQEYVIGVQLYNFSFSSTKPWVSCLKVNYITGIVHEKEEINAIVQSYYEYGKFQLKSFSKKLQNAIDGNVKGLMDFIEQNSKYLNGKNIKDIKDQDALILSLIQIGLNHLEKRYQFITVGQLIRHDILKALNQKKRTGIARSIINHKFYENEPFYSFHYTGEGDGKASRKYITYIVKTKKGEDLLFLITLRTEPFWDAYTEKKYMEQIRSEFRNSLSKTELFMIK